MNKLPKEQAISTIQKRIVGDWTYFFYVIYNLSLIIALTSIICGLLGCFSMNSSIFKKVIYSLQLIQWIIIPSLIIFGSIDIYSLYLAKQEWIKQQPVSGK